MTVSICVISSGDYWKERFAIETALRNARDMEVELLLFKTILSEDKRIINFVDGLLEPNDKGDLVSKQYPSLLRTATEYNHGLKDTVAYNTMFKEAKCDYFCLLSPSCIVKPNWLHDMVFVAERLEKAGLVSIQHALVRQRHFYIPDSAENNLLFCAPNNSEFTGATLFNRKVYSVFGGFDESLVSDKTPSYYAAFFEELKRNDFINVSVPDQFLIYNDPQAIFVRSRN